MKSCLCRLPELVLMMLSCVGVLSAQGPGQILYGDVRADESKVEGLKPLSFDIILYTEGGVIVGRQVVPNNGRYRFNNLGTGVYEVAVEVEGKEVTRLRVDLRSPLLGELKQDIALEWKPVHDTSLRPSVISVADRYERSSANDRLFDKARKAIDKKDYNQAAELLRRIVGSDPKDFQAWTELANVHFLQKDLADAENEYLQAIDLHPGFFLALFNLGRLRITMKRYDVAVEALTKAVKARPESPDANYFLGEAYLQLKKGSLAVGYLNEAIRLDPQGMAEVHLRLAALYHGAGLKDKAAAEYEQFLEKRPDSKDRKKLEQYITENKRR
jgi:tetratricopeptide (TPR) repeat protein